MRRFIGFATVVAAAVLASSSGAITAPPTSFTDPTGDAGSAPDITNVAVTNDDHGQYTFTITFATSYSGSAVAAIFLNTDRNLSTGDPNNDGAEYLFDDDYGSHTFELDSWTNNSWQTAASSTANVTVASDNKSMTMSVNKSDLGGATSFDFFVLSSDGQFTDGHFDYLPTLGDATYDLQTVFALSTGTFHTGAAKAGGTWTVSMTAVRSDTGQTITSGASVACAAKEGKKALPVRSSSFSGSGAAVCTFSVPKKPKNANVRATVTVTDNGQSTTKTFSATTH